MPQQQTSKTPSSTVGRNLSVPAYYEGQVCILPDHYVTRERARELVMTGEARRRDRGTAILLLRRKPEGVADTHRHSVKTRWAIVGQTAKPFTDMHSMGTPVKYSDPENPVYRKPAPRPGFPRYALV